MDVETLFSRHYRADAAPALYSACQSLPLIRGIKGTHGAPTHIVSYPSVKAGSPTLVLQAKREPVGRRNSHSSAPMWRKSLYLKGGTTGARWVKQHLTRSYDRGHLHPKGMRGQEHDAKRLMRLSTTRQEVSQLGRVW